MEPRAPSPAPSVGKVSQCSLDSRDTSGCTLVRARMPVHSAAGALRSWGTFTPTRGSTAGPHPTAASSVDAASVTWEPTRATAAPRHSNQPGCYAFTHTKKCMAETGHGADSEVCVVTVWLSAGHMGNRAALLRRLPVLSCSVTVIDISPMHQASRKPV